MRGKGEERRSFGKKASPALGRARPGKKKKKKRGGGRHRGKGKKKGEEKRFAIHIAQGLPERKREKRTDRIPQKKRGGRFFEVFTHGG